MTGFADDLRAAVASHLAGADLDQLAEELAAIGSLSPERARRVIVAGADEERKRHELARAEEFVSLPLEKGKNRKEFGDQGEGSGISSFVSVHGPLYKNRIEFLTARELSELSSHDIPWIVEGLLARDAITELSGKVKSAGKTTFALWLSRAVIDGLNFLGKRTEAGPVVMLSEQGRSSLKSSLRHAGLLDRDEIHLLLWHSAAGVPWPDVVAQAVEKCRSEGARVLIIDTFGQFANLYGESENSAGHALAAMHPLQLAAAAGLGVFLARHDRKSGGEIGDSARGSSAISGAVDIVLRLRRGDGNTPKTVRILEGLSRFEETPQTLVVELGVNGYTVVGDTADFARQEARRFLDDTLPTSEEAAVAFNTLYEEIAGQGASKATAKRVLREMVDEGAVYRIGEGKKGDPYQYFVSDPGARGRKEMNSEPIRGSL